MPEYLSPGVYVEEVPSTIKPIVGVSTSTASFVGVVPDSIDIPEENPNFDPTKPIGDDNKKFITWAFPYPKADFDKHGRAAPFRANDEMLELDPVCVLTLANSLNSVRAGDMKPFGPALNLAQKAAERGLRHHPVKARA